MKYFTDSLYENVQKTHSLFKKRQVDLDQN